jgi:diacylglycerol kinase (ATP)
MITLVNPHAGAGSGLTRWQRIEPLMRERFGDFRTVILDGPATVACALREAMRSGDTRIVAAGGDGTVNAVVHELLSGPPEYARTCELGAIGLGSSNDFHKPFTTSGTVGGLPARLDFDAAARCDAGRIILTLHGASTTRHFLLNASAGITAEGNRRFNQPGPVLGLLKKINVRSAIAYAAITALVGYKNIPVRLTIPGSGTIALALTNLGIVKTPYFSGDLHYDIAGDYTNGRFGVVACEHMNVPQRYTLFRALTRGRITHLEHVRSWSVSEAVLSAARPMLIEFDGEIALAETAHFSVVPQALKVCP